MRRANLDAFRQLIFNANANGFGGIFSIPPEHNRIEIIVGQDSTVLAGNVAVSRMDGAAESGVTISGLLGTIAYNSGGSATVYQVAPGASVRTQLAGYAGTGYLRVLMNSWREK